MALTYHRKKKDLKDQNTADPWKIAGVGVGFKKDEQPQTPLSESITGMFKDEQIACWLDGNASPELQRDILTEMYRNDRFAQFLSVASDTDTEGELSQEGSYPKTLPLGAQAASESNETTLCALHCEIFIMQHLGRPVDADVWIERARKHGWLTPSGMRIGHLGNGLEAEGLTVEKHFDASIPDLQNWLSRGQGVIAVVDGGELMGDRRAEKEEDQYVGEIPDHAIVILCIDTEAGIVTIYDPQSKHPTDQYPLEQFDDAWEDSCHYAIVVDGSHPA